MYQGNSIPTTITALSQFDARLKPIAGFIQREGHADIPLEHREDGQPIGYWCSNWRFRIETAIGTIPPEQIEALRQIGFLPNQPPLQQPSEPEPDPVAALAQLFSQIPEPQNQTSEDFCIPAGWLKPEKKLVQQQESWSLPVGQLRPVSRSDAPVPKVAVKKRRWLQVAGRESEQLP